MIVAQVDPGENTSKIVNDLSNTDLPELMAMVLVFASIALMLYMVYKIVSVLRGGKQSTEQDTVKIIAETFGAIIADKLKTIMDDIRTEAQTNTEEHGGIVKAQEHIVKALNKHGTIMQTIAELITNHSNNAVENRTIIDQTKEAVNIMNTDIDQIKTDLATVKETLGNISKSIADGVPMSADSIAVMQQFINCAKQLEETIVKSTQETKEVAPEAPKPKVAKPELAVPSTRDDIEKGKKSL